MTASPLVEEPREPTLGHKLLRAARPPARANWIGVPVLLLAGYLLFVWQGGTATNDNLMTQAAWYGILGLGFYIAYALGGIFSFGLAGFAGLGAYVSAYFTQRDGLDWPWWAGIIAAALVCGIAGLALGVLLRHAHAFTFAIGSLAFAEVVHTVIRQWKPLAGERSGFIVGIPRLSIGDEFLDTAQIFRFMLLAFAAVAAIALIFQRAPFRRELFASRDGQDIALALGLPAMRLRLIAFTLSSAIIGVGGGIYAHWRGTLTPETFSVSMTLNVFLMVVIGGVRTMWGIVPGVLFVVYLPQVVSFSDTLPALLYALALLVVLIVFPRGIIGGIGGIDMREWARRLVGHRTHPVRPSPAPITGIDVDVDN